MDEYRDAASQPERLATRASTMKGGTIGNARAGGALKDVYDRTGNAMLRLREARYRIENRLNELLGYVPQQSATRIAVDETKDAGSAVDAMNRQVNDLFDLVEELEVLASRVEEL